MVNIYASTQNKYSIIAICECWNQAILVFNRYLATRTIPDNVRSPWIFLFNQHQKDTGESTKSKPQVKIAAILYFIPSQGFEGGMG